jgi:hypothetical protein
MEIFQAAEEELETISARTRKGSDSHDTEVTHALTTTSGTKAPAKSAHYSRFVLVTYSVSQMNSGPAPQDWPMVPVGAGQQPHHTLPQGPVRAEQRRRQAENKRARLEAEARTTMNEQDY